MLFTLLNLYGILYKGDFTRSNNNRIGDFDMTVNKIVKTLCKAALAFSAGYFVGRIVSDKEWEDIMDEESAKLYDECPDDDEDDDCLDDDFFMDENDDTRYTSLNMGKSLYNDKSKEDVDWAASADEDAVKTEDETAKESDTEDSSTETKCDELEQ